MRAVAYRPHDPPRHPACRVDIQVDTGGAFALAEWARGGARVVPKTNGGPRLGARPREREAAP